MISSGTSPSTGCTAGLARITNPSWLTTSTASPVLPSTARNVLCSSASAWYTRELSSAEESPAAISVAICTSSAPYAAADRLAKISAPIISSPRRNGTVKAARRPEAASAPSRSGTPSLASARLSTTLG